MLAPHPSYRLHKARNCAVVTLDGKNHYLGPFGSAESYEKYHRLVAEWLARARKPAATVETVKPGLTVNALLLRYFEHVQSYYVKNGKPTSEPGVIRSALGFMRRLYGTTLAQDFSPKKLKAVRQAMIEHPITRLIKVRDPESGECRMQSKVLRHGLTRRLINKQIQRIRRMFAWAVEEELLPVTVHQALLRVRGLKRGRTAAWEKPRVRSVPDAWVEATLPHVPPAVMTMIQIQRLSGSRPQDVVQMRAIDIEMSGPIWEYRPGRYKTEHLDADLDPDRERVVFLGPKAQALLKPFLTLNLMDFLFSPERSEQLRQVQRRRRRRTPLWASHECHVAKKRAKSRKRPPRSCYDTTSYRQAIRRACEKAGVTVWTPNQLRHSRLTEIRRRYGLEASKACGGHKEIGVTQHYAEQDRTLAARVMAEIG